MTSDQVLAFIEVVQAGGYHAASRKLHISQPAISAAIKKIEQEFGFALFEKVGRQVRLSEKGQQFYESALVMRRAFSELVSHGEMLAENRETQLTIAIGDLVPCHFILDFFKRFYQEHPECKLILNFEGVHGAAERVKEESADLGISSLHDEYLDAFEVQHLMQTQLIPVYHQNHALAEEKITRVALEKHVQIIIRDTSRQAQQSYGISEGQKGRCTVADQRTKKDMIMAGIGWGRLPDHLIQAELQNGELRRIDEKWVAAPWMNLYCYKSKTKALGFMGQTLWNELSQFKAGSNHVNALGP